MFCFRRSHSNKNKDEKEEIGSKLAKSSDTSDSGVNLDSSHNELLLSASALGKSESVKTGTESEDTNNDSSKKKKDSRNGVGQHRTLAEEEGGAGSLKKHNSSGSKKANTTSRSASTKTPSAKEPQVQVAIHSSNLTLVVLVPEADRLPSKYGKNTTVRVYLCPETKVSAVKARSQKSFIFQDSTNPLYEMEARFALDPSMVEKHVVIVVKAYGVLNNMTCLGQVVIPLAEHIVSSSSQFQIHMKKTWFPLQPQDKSILTKTLPISNKIRKSLSANNLKEGTTLKRDISLKREGSLLERSSSMDRVSGVRRSPSQNSLLKAGGKTASIEVMHPVESDEKKDTVTSEPTESASIDSKLYSKTASQHSLHKLDNEEVAKEEATSSSNEIINPNVKRKKSVSWGNVEFFDADDSDDYEDDEEEPVDELTFRPGYQREDFTMDEAEIERKAAMLMSDDPLDSFLLTSYDLRGQKYTPPPPSSSIQDEEDEDDEEEKEKEKDSTDDLLSGFLNTSMRLNIRDSIAVAKHISVEEIMEAGRNSPFAAESPVVSSPTMEKRTQENTEMNKRVVKGPPVAPKPKDLAKRVKEMQAEKEKAAAAGSSTTTTTATSTSPSTKSKSTTTGKKKRKASVTKSKKIMETQKKENDLMDSFLSVANKPEEEAEEDSSCEEEDPRIAALVENAEIDPDLTERVVLRSKKASPPTSTTSKKSPHEEASSDDDDDDEEEEETAVEHVDQVISDLVVQEMEKLLEVAEEKLAQ